jgi:hypothetical protein
MTIWFRAITAGVLALALSGCILQSKSPLFTDAQAQLALAKYGTLATYEKSGNDWKRSSDQISFTPTANHYIAKAGKSELEISFVPIDGNWWALQAVEAARPATYVLVDAEARELLFYPIACKDLKDGGKFADAIAFVDSDCFVKPGADYKALFKSLTSTPGEASAKLVSTP